MASWDHEGIIELFRNEPSLAPELLAGPLGIAVPSFSEARLEPATMAELHPAELRADLVVTLREGESAVLGIVIEIQRHEDPDKRYSWPAYVSLLYRNLQAPACLLVVTQSEAVARWAARPIIIGPGHSFTPLVLGPATVPIVSQLEAARRSPELAVLSAMVHGAGPVETALPVALSAAMAASELDRDRFLLYFDLIHAALGEAARKAFEMHPQGVQFFDESLQKSYDRGRVASKIAAVLAVLEARSIVLTDEERTRIASCTDAELLDRWIRRAATVASAAELFS